MGEATDAPAATEQTRQIWSTLGSVEDEVWKVEAMLKSVAAIFSSGARTMLEGDACLGGEQIVYDILERWERVDAAIRQASEETGVRASDETEAA